MVTDERFFETDNTQSSLTPSFSGVPRDWNSVLVDGVSIKEFHGNAFYYFRNDALNANSFFNNTNGIKRPRYRYNTFGGTFGGPIFWPGKFNKDKNKLFFFSTEILPTINPRALTQLTMPTDIERGGDFSKTLDVSGALIPIKDPLNGGTPFAGNVVPKNCLDPRGQALMNLLPMPNFFDRSITRGNYNYNFQDLTKQFTSQNLATYFTGLEPVEP